MFYKYDEYFSLNKNREVGGKIPLSTSLLNLMSLFISFNVIRINGYGSIRYTKRPKRPFPSIFMMYMIMGAYDDHKRQQHNSSMQQHHAQSAASVAAMLFCAYLSSTMTT
jgi:hypothetical protein